MRPDRRRRCGLDRNQENYLLNVLRLREGDAVLVFNGREGEWRAAFWGPENGTLLSESKPAAPATTAGRSALSICPLKHARLDYLVQKAVEMGASHLQPVMTRHTQVARVNLDRMRANAIEAAEQCGVLHVPTVGVAVGLEAAVTVDRLLIFCDENAEVADPVGRTGGGAAATVTRFLSLLVPRAALPTRNGRCSQSSRMWFGSRLARAFCARTRPRLRRLHWSRPFSATGPRVRTRTCVPQAGGDLLKAVLHSEFGSGEAQR